MCSRPAESTITTSNPRLPASATAPLARATGSSSPAGSYTRTPAFWPTTFSCWMAAGRLTSVDTSSGCRPCLVSHFASLPAVVVLPAPCSPSSRTTRGRLLVGWQPAFGVAEERQHLVADDLDDLLRRRQAAEDVLPHRPVAHPVDERLDDLEVDVRLEQRQPNLAQRGLDVLRRQPRLAAQGLEDVLKACAEGVEHDALTCSSANAYRSGARTECQTQLAIWSSGRFGQLVVQTCECQLTR